MPPKKSVSFVPEIDRKILRRATGEPSRLYQSAAENTKDFNRLMNSVPSAYEWHYRTAEAFQTQSKPIKHSSGRFRFYWNDMLGQVQAMSIMNSFRLADVARSAIWAVNRQDTLCAAIMARAALETAASYAWFQTEVRPILSETASTTESFPIYEKLEEVLLKTLHASRTEGVEEFYKPTNIVTTIEKISKKIPHQEEVLIVYSELCEVAHPNWLGRSTYITSTQETQQTGHDILTLSRKYGETATHIEMRAIEALSWSMGTFCLSCSALQNAVKHMTDRIEGL